MMRHALLATAAMVAVAVVAASAQAHADDNSYLSKLNQSGVSIPQTDNVRLTTGHYICGRLATRATWQDLVRELTNTFFYSPEAADVQIQAAQSELCPDRLRR